MACDKWVPVTTAWRVLRLRMEERPPIWRVAANKLNKQSRTADKGWSSSLGVGRGANNASPWKPHVKKYSQGEMLPLETKQSGGKLLPHSDLRGGVFLVEVPRRRQRRRDIVLGTWNKMDLQEVRGGCGDWIELAQDRDRWRALVSTVMNIRVPKKRRISWLAAEPVSFSWRTLFHGVSKYKHGYLVAEISPILFMHLVCACIIHVRFFEIHFFTA